MLKKGSIAEKIPIDQFLSISSSANEINLLNKKNKHYRQIIINNKLRSSTNIPGVVGYRNYFTDKMNPIR